MMSPEEIARRFREKGEEVTPDEIRADIRSIAAKFRAVVKAGKMGGDCEILISNMECNKYDRVIRTRRGNVQPFDKNCVIV